MYTYIRTFLPRYHGGSTVAYLTVTPSPATHHGLVTPLSITYWRSPAIFARQVFPAVACPIACSPFLHFPITSSLSLPATCFPTLPLASLETQTAETQSGKNSGETGKEYRGSQTAKQPNSPFTAVTTLTASAGNTLTKEIVQSMLE